MDFESSNRQIRLPKKAEKVKNKAAAPLQITAEQLLREAKERELEIVPRAPKVRVNDPEEAAEQARKKRKEFEDNIRKNRNQLANWIKYAKWEESIGEIARARSVLERALDVDHRNITIWLQYAEMEMRNKQINHARNIWDRAVQILPRAMQFWLKYTYMEELIENVPGARQVFERWMEWEPDVQAWNTYINFELRYHEIDRARGIYQRFLHVHGNDYKNWVRYARFEEKFGYIGNARVVFEQAVVYFGDDAVDEQLLIQFAKFEERQKEVERARVIYNYGLNKLPQSKTKQIFDSLAIHEKKYGERVRIENVIIAKRRRKYEDQLTLNSYDYDTWFDYVNLLTTEQVPREEVEDVFERAVANIPPYEEKRYWRRYIYLWISYALYEEIDVEDVERTRDVYKACLEVIPHKKFTFAKIWIMFAMFEIRQLDLAQARKIMGNAIGKCPKKKLFTAYIDLEMRFRDFDRCRILYEKLVLFMPDSSNTWIKFAELEGILGDTDRARAIYNMAIQQPALDMPEVLWKSYIDFEISEGENDHVRRLYNTLLEKTNHIKVWVSFTEFEERIENFDRARATFKSANEALEQAPSEERLLLLETWQKFEEEHGTPEQVEAVKKLMPKRVKRRRPIHAEDGTDAGWEEYFDYIFPQDEASKLSFKLLQWAAAQKRTAAAAPLDGNAEEPAEPAAKRHRDDDSGSDRDENDGANRDEDSGSDRSDNDE
uniref:TPR_REGION domain-containing protein n=1 Tax=Panagrellus redivivus TaxID=6233 RepID=A0A7E4W298_PANRE